MLLGCAHVLHTHGEQTTDSYRIAIKRRYGVLTTKAVLLEKAKLWTVPALFVVTQEENNEKEEELSFFSVNIILCGWGACGICMQIPS